MANPPAARKVPTAAPDARTIVIPLHPPQQQQQQSRPPRGTPQHGHVGARMPLPAPQATPPGGAVMPQPRPQPYQQQRPYQQQNAAARPAPPAPAPSQAQRALAAQPQPIAMPVPLGPPMPPRAMPSTDAADNARVLELTRRVALQRDLAGAIGVIDIGISELIAASVAVAVIGPGTQVWSPRATDLRAAASVVRLDTVAQVARGPEPAVTPHAVVVPLGVTTPTGVTAAIIAHRPPTAPALAAREVLLIAAVVHQIAPIVHGFLVEHADRAAREAADHHGLFRAEAVRKARAGDPHGVPISLTSTWLRWAYPTILGLVAILFLAAALVEVPSYSTGAAIVQIEGEEITSPTGGTVAAIAVGPGDTVATGDELLRLHAIDQEAELARLDAEYRSALAVFLVDPADSNARGSLATITASRQRALAAVDSRVIRATRAGVVNDIRVQLGELMTPGAHILSIVDHDAAPTVVALLPGADRPRLRVGMILQVQLAGYAKVREEAEITFVGAEAIGPMSARKYLGETVADALHIDGLVVIVRARLKHRTFEARGTTYTFHDGMPGLGEVEVESKSFLRTLIGKE